MIDNAVSAIISIVAFIGFVFLLGGTHYDRN